MDLFNTADRCPKHGVLLVGYILFCTAVQVVNGIPNEPEVYWSMDSHRDLLLLPDHGDEHRYTVNLQPSRKSRFTTGIIGQAISIASEKLKMIPDITKSDCIRNPSACQDGLTISFWLNVKKLAQYGSQMILRSMNHKRTRLGVYVGGDEDTSKFLFLIRTAEGKQYIHRIPWSTLMLKWSHLALTWNLTEGLQVFINGSKLQDKQIVENGTSSTATKTNLWVGDIPGPTFLLDDFWIFYHTLPKESIYHLYELGLSSTKPAEIRDKEQPTDDVTGTTTATNDLGWTNQVNSVNEESTAAEDESEYSSTRPRLSQTLPTPELKLKNTSVLETTATMATSQIVASTPLEKTTFQPFSSMASKTKATIKQRENSPPVTPYMGWFYNQSWYHIMVGAILFTMFAISMWLCVTHCCVRTVSDTNKMNLPPDDVTSMEPLVQQT